MAKSNAFFGPSDKALAFGAQYSRVLAQWGDLFASASALVESNVELGRMANDAAKEFDDWVKLTANAPWNWLNPDALAQTMRAFSEKQPPKA